MTEAAARDPRIVAVQLMRNHGHQLALTAGLTVCRGERILIIDADLQDPPELLPDMMALMDQGADVVYGQRRQRDGESLFKRATAAAFYRLIGRMTDVEIPLDAGDFRLMTRRVLDLLLAMPERHRFIRGMVAWIGGRQVPLAYDRQARVAGESKYPLAKMVRFAADAITAFSVVPLMASMTIGWVMAAVGFAFFVYSIVGWLIGAQSARLDVADGRDRPAGRHAVPDAGHHRRLSRPALRPEQGPAAVHDPRHRRRPEMKPAEFDRLNSIGTPRSYDGGLDNPVKRLMGYSADQFIAVKARWLLRREPRSDGRRPCPARLWLRRGRPDARAGGLGRACGLHRLRRVDRHAGRGRQSLAGGLRSRAGAGRRRTVRARPSPTASSTSSPSAPCCTTCRRPSARPSIASSAAS